MCFSLFWFHPLGHLRPGFLFSETAVSGTMQPLFFLSTPNKVTQRPSVLSSSSSFLPSTEQHEEGNILILLSSPQKPSTWPSDDHMLGYIYFLYKINDYPGYTHFHSFPPSLSALCNPILSRTGAPPPRQLTFPLIHNKVPLGENNCTTVYSHYEASTDLIQVIKVAAVNELTDLETLPILLLILFTGMMTLVDRAVGKVSRSREKGSILCCVCHV